MKGKVEQPKLNRTIRADDRVFVGGIERGMIFWGGVEPSETRDMEHFHPATDPCPWLVVSADALHRKQPIAIVVPLSSNPTKELRGYRIRIPDADLGRYDVQPPAVPLPAGDALVLTEQIRVFAHARFQGDPIAKVGGLMLAGFEAGAKQVLDFG